MPQARINVDTLFCEAIAIGDADARVAYIDQASESNPQLRQHLEKLVAAHFEAGEFLQRPVGAVDVTSQSVSAEPSATAVAAEVVGSTIGPYKIRELLGEGGMGSVYVAEQERPVRRKVALKLIKPGMDSQQVIARFEAERQALAMMDHPHIAKVLDAGTADNGRPYFVMELIKGAPITEHCDTECLAIRARLELFLQVCQAVQHAHQKGIVHRDLKPSNIIVAIHDTTPVVKVIDFGVAKAMGQQLTDHSLYTGFSQLIGTPLYMSPEQAGRSSLDIDTRSDIYSLGVLLYELLTGTTPFESERLKHASYDELRRIIREEEPPRPSTRLSTLAAASLSTIAELRQVEPRRLSQETRGELDWIVMKALEKDRQRRYESASALAADVQRYLNYEPVEACPPSAAYRMRKFVRRHAAALATVLAIALALVIGAVISLWQAAEAKQARAVAVRERQDGERNLEQARTAIDKLVDRLRDDTVPPAPQFDGVRQAVLGEAIQLYEQLLAQKGNTPAVRFSVARAWRQIGEVKQALGEVEESVRAYDISFRMLEELAAGYPEETSYIAELAEASRWQAISSLYRSPKGSADRQRAEVSLRRALVLRKVLAKLEPDHWEHRRDAFSIQIELEQLPGRKNDLDWMHRRLETARRFLSEHPDDIGCLWLVIDAQRALTRSFVWSHRGEADEIRFLTEEAVQLVQRGLDHGAPERAWRILLAGVLFEKGLYREREGELSEAEPAMRQGVAVLDDLSRRLLLDRADEGLRADHRILLGELLQAQERLTEAEQIYQAALNYVPADDWAHRSNALFHLVTVQMQQGRVDSATSSLKDYVDAAGRDKPDPASATESWSAIVVTAELMRREAAGEAGLSVEVVLDQLQIRAWKNEESARVELLECVKNLAVKDGRFFPRTRLALAQQAAELLIRTPPADSKNAAQAFNTLAWQLVTNPDRRMWDPGLAVELGQQAVAIDPGCVNAWNTLGVAHYRAGNDAGAIEALSKSIQLGSGGGAYDFYFLAAAHWKTGNKRQARDWYDKGVAWTKEHSPVDDELKRFHAEAAELLGITDEQATNRAEKAQTTSE